MGWLGPKGWVKRAAHLVLQHDVLGLQVAVRYALDVAMGQGAEDLPHDVARLGQRQLARFEQL